MAARRVNGKWFIDFRFQHADGRVERMRKRSPIQSRAGAEEFERQLRASLIAPVRLAKEVPTFSTYATDFLKTYVATNNKPSEQAAKASMLKHHLLPAFGEMRLDHIKTHSIEQFKAQLLSLGLGRKRVNNILACLGKMLRYAHEIELIETVARVKLLKVQPPKFDFLTFEEYQRLIDAVKIEPERRALLLAGGDAGLRQGELMALQWGDVDLVAGTLTVRRSSWRGILGTPKSGRERKIPLTARLSAALKRHRHLRGELVFCHTDGSPLTQSAIEAALRFACKRGGLRPIGSHVLRHTFCSHLAMRGAAPKAVQELAGHSTLTMTLRYMHLAPSALYEAIALLNFGPYMGNAESASA
ncbi:MAG: tyrosine-type recombinase/integrase [Polyangiaceae bacterium]|nr:tyrosine-type recombinase/integrase [Polyangiaceae bacterium]